MAHNKLQHYVPKFLLKNFAIPESDGRSIVVGNLTSKTFHERANVRGQCASNYYYGRDGKLEKILSEIENFVSRVLRTIRTSGTLPEEGTKEWYELTSFIMIQQQRTMGAENEANVLATSLYRDILRDDFSPELLAAITVRKSISPLERVQWGVRLTKDVLDLADVLVHNHTDLEFVLPDTGCVFHNDWARECQKEACGTLSQGLQIFMPISPRHVLIKFDQAVYTGHHRATVNTSSLADIKTINRLMIASADRNVYFSGDSETRRFLSNFDTHPRAPSSERVRLVRLKNLTSPEIATAFWPMPIRFSAKLSFMRQHQSVVFIPSAWRDGMYRATAYTKRRREEPEWIRTGHYSVNALSPPDR